MNNLGFLYENGMGGLPKSDAEAIKWCAKAASLGDTHAQESLKRLRSVVSKSDNLAERAGQYPPIVVAKAKSGDVDRC
jgi:TPR repeat protein